MKTIFLILFLVAAPVYAAISSATVWQIQADGVSTNGGGYTSGGTDYSQQAAAQLTVTDASGAGTTTLTSGTGGFTTAMVGNLIQISGGTLTAGFYEIITRTDTNNVVLDRTPGTGTLSTVNVGGALNRVGAIGSATAGLGAVAGNVVWVKSGTYNLTASDTVACAGTSTLPLVVIGYASTRTGHGDGYQGRTPVGALVTTNMPLMSYDSSTRMVISGAWVMLESVAITGSISNVMLDLNGTAATASRCKVTNTGTGAASGGIETSGTRAFVFDSDVVCSGASGGGSRAGIYMSSGSVGTVDSCRVSVASTSADAIQAGLGSTVLNCTIFGGCLRGIAVTTTSYYTTLRNNTIYGCAGDGINIVTGSTVTTRIIGNMITDNAGYGINLNNANVGAFLAANRTRDNASGAINLGTRWVTATNFSPVTTDTGGASSDYVAVGSLDFNLIATSPATSASVPASASMGALQRTQTGGGQRSYSF